jgi:hypothetical protein
MAALPHNDARSSADRAPLPAQVARPLGVDNCRTERIALRRGKGSCLFVFPRIPVNVELGHQSDEYSSAIEPDFELNLFHAATVASTTFDLDLARCCLSRMSASRKRNQLFCFATAS